MTVLANHRRELFAQLLAQGFTEVDAHERAGYRRNDGNASTLAQHPEVQARLKEIKGELAAKAVVTAETLINEADEMRVRALENGQLSAAVAAIKEKGVLSGKRIERAEVGTAGEFDALTDDELERALMERVARLGFTDLGETQR